MIEKKNQLQTTEQHVHDDEIISTPLWTPSTNYFWRALGFNSCIMRHRCPTTRFTYWIAILRLHCFITFTWSVIFEPWTLDSPILLSLDNRMWILIFSSSHYKDPCHCWARREFKLTHVVVWHAICFVHFRVWGPLCHLRPPPQSMVSQLLMYSKGAY